MIFADLKAPSSRLKNQMKLWCLVFVLAAPMPCAWVLWYFEIGIPKGQNVAGELLPNVNNLFSWPIIQLEDSTQQPNNSPKNQWFLVFKCSENQCPNKTLWQIHRALGRDADRLVRYGIIDRDQSQVLSSTENYPGNVWWQLEATQTADEYFKHQSIWLADPSGNIVLAYQTSTPPKTLLQDIKKVLRRNPEPPSWLKPAINMSSSKTAKNENEPLFLAIN